MIADPQSPNRQDGPDKEPVPGPTPPPTSKVRGALTPLALGGGSYTWCAMVFEIAWVGDVAKRHGGWVMDMLSFLGAVLPLFVLNSL